MTLRTSRRTRGNSGQTLILFVLLVPVLVIMAALAIEPVRVAAAGAVVQEAADAAALAGARALLDATVTEDVVRTRVQDVASGNDVHAGTGTHGGLTLDSNATNSKDGDIVLGHYDVTTGIFTEATPPIDMTAVDAVKVNGHVASGWTPTGFATFGGASAATIARTAVAAVGGPSVDRPTVPIALDTSWFAGIAAQITSPIPVAFSPGLDNIEWTGFTSGHNDALVSGYINDPVSIPQVAVGTTIDMTNGVMAASWHALQNANLVGQDVEVTVADLSGPNEGQVEGFAVIHVTSIDVNGRHSELDGDLVQLSDLSGTKRTASTRCYGFACTALLRN